MSTETRSTTVGPASSALCRSSAGIHLLGSPEGRFDLGRSGQVVQALPEGEHPPPWGAAPRHLDPEGRMTYVAAGRSTESRVRTGGST